MFVSSRIHCRRISGNTVFWHAVFANGPLNAYSGQTLPGHGPNVCRLAYYPKDVRESTSDNGWLYAPDLGIKCLISWGLGPDFGHVSCASSQ